MLGTTKYPQLQRKAVPVGLTESTDSTQGILLALQTEDMIIFFILDLLEIQIHCGR